MPDDLIGTTDAAKQIEVERSTLVRWVQLGRITPAVKMPGKTGALLFRVEDVEALAAWWAANKPEAKAS